MTTNHLLKKEILELIYHKFHAIKFTPTDFKTAICDDYDISTRLMDKHFRYLLRKSYIRNVPGTKQYRFIVTIEDWSFGGEVH
jgi:hypothetical protein